MVTWLMASGFKVGSFVILATVLTTGILLLGEIALVLAYVVLPISVITRWPNRKMMGMVTVVVFGAALILHLAGFKLLGRATVTERQSLHKPRRIASLEPPNVIRFADSSTAAIANVFFPRGIEVTNAASGHYESFRSIQNLRPLVEPETKPPIGIQVEVTEPTNETSGVAFLQRQSYWCGNTWTPQFFPEPLPRRVRADLAPILISAGLALPSAEYVRKGPRRHDALIAALNDMVIPDLPQQHLEIERLALALIDHRQWEKGLDLLIGTGATNSILLAQTRIVEQLEKVSRKEDPGAGTSNGWMGLLLKVDPQAAGKALHQLLTASDFDVEQASALAGSMAAFDDISGFDLLIARLAKQDLSSESLRKLSLHLQSWFRFDIYLNGGGCPNDIHPEFLEWHGKVRPRLSCRRLPTGRHGFALDGGIPFDSAYYESMKPFKDRIAQRHGRSILRYRFYD